MGVLRTSRNLNQLYHGNLSIEFIPINKVQRLTDLLVTQLIRSRAEQEVDQISLVWLQPIQFGGGNRTKI